MNIPLADSSDEVMVRDVDGAWKILRGGVLYPVSPAPVPVVAQPLEIPTQARIPVQPTIANTPARLVPILVSAPAPTMAGLNKRPMHDIIPPKVLVGPLEELRMSLKDYAVLADSPAQRVQRIKQKIKMLEQEDYGKRLEGMSSWKMSEVFRLYVVLGQESVLSGLSIADTIGKRITAGQPTLSVEDFQAITEMNNELRN